MINEDANYSNLFGKNLLRFRTMKGLSLRQLAILAEMEHHQILKIEKGGDLRLSSIYKLAKALDVAPQAFFEDHNE